MVGAPTVYYLYAVLILHGSRARQASLSAQPLVDRWNSLAVYTEEADNRDHVLVVKARARPVLLDPGPAMQRSMSDLESGSAGKRAAEEPPLMDLTRERSVTFTPAEVAEMGRQSMRAFLEKRTCYDVMKDSSKVVVFDVAIAAKLAFFVLVEHGIVAAPLWDSGHAAFAGLMTASDFLGMYLQCYQPGASSDNLSDHTIASWKTHYNAVLARDAAAAAAAAGSCSSGASSSSAGTGAATQAVAAGSAADTMSDVTAAAGAAAAGAAYNPLAALAPDDSLLQAVHLFRRQRASRASHHQLPLVDAAESAVLAVLTQRLILNDVVANYREQRKLFDQSCMDLGIGTHGAARVATASLDDPLIRVFRLLHERRLAAVPLVDDKGAVACMYSRNDITLLGKSQQTQLDAAVGTVVQQQHEQGLFAEQLMLCAPSITLHNAFELLSTNQKVLHLVCVDSDQRPIGIVSISDIFDYFASDAPVPAGAGAASEGISKPRTDSWTGQDIEAMAEV